MSATEVAPPSSYSDIAALHDRRLLLYQAFGSYQGEWMMFAVSRDGDEYAIYRDWYGSCSGCDDLEGTFHSSEEVPQVKVTEWADKYRPFALVPAETLKNLVLGDSLLKVFPANVRDSRDIDMGEFAAECALIAKLELDLDLTPADAFASRNQETRRRIIERVGISQFVQEVLHTDERGDMLVTLGDGGRYLYLNDASTDRRYVLRVPPDVQTVQEGKAWSFGLDTQEYAPLIET